MPLSTLDDVPALVVVDLSEGLPPLPPVLAVVANSAQLAGAFRSKGWPVILVSVAGVAPGRTDAAAAAAATAAANNAPAAVHQFTDNVAPELDEQPTDLRIIKRTWSAFTGTDLHQQLASRGVTQVVVTGVATSIGVESTARLAHELGYHVVVVTDAVVDLNADAHENSINRIFPRIAETTTTLDVLAAAGSPQS